jgi:hypothetical protein
MAENKKSFVLYTDLIHTFKHLTKEQRGEIIYWLLEYTNDLNPKPLDGLLQAVVEPIVRQLKRDLIKWEKKHNQRVLAGKKSAEVRKRNATTVNDRSISSTVTVTDTVTVNVNDINNNYNKFVDEVSKGEHDSAIEQMYMRLKLKKGALTPLLKTFKGQLIIDSTLHKNTLEFRKHFNNWLNMQEKVGKLDAHKKRN